MPKVVPISSARKRRVREEQDPIIVHEVTLLLSELPVLEKLRRDLNLVITLLQIINESPEA